MTDNSAMHNACVLAFVSKLATHHRVSYSGRDRRLQVPSTYLRTHTNTPIRREPQAIRLGRVMYPLAQRTCKATIAPQRCDLHANV